MNIRYCILALPLAMLAACHVLDQEPESAFTETNFYKTSGDALAAVNAIYDPLPTNDMYSQIMLAYQDQGTDDCEWGGGRNTANQAKNDVDKYTFTSATVYFYTTWSTCYKAINRANAVMGRVPGVNMDQALKDRMIAEAKFLRGFYYFTLVRLFGKVPLYLTETTSLTNLGLPRSPVAEVYAQIIADFTAAEAGLPQKYTGADVGRATQGAAKGMLAKVYLTQGEWQKAVDKCKELMAMETQGVYGLWPNYSDVFLIANKNGKESLFEAQALGGGYGEGTALEGYLRPTFDRNGFGDDPVTQNHYQAYTSRDKRRDVNVKLYTTAGTPAAPASITFPCYVSKYKDPSSTGNGDGSNNFILLRYADILLMFAEASYELQEGSADAYTAVNRIRMRAGLADLTPDLTQAQFRDSILQERRLELAFEGHRRYDLVRRNKLIDAMKAQNPTIVVEPRHYLYPVPQTERDANSLLDQNDNY